MALNVVRKWSEEETCWFVDLYKRNECLWNPTNVHYRNTGSRQAAYEAMRREMQMDGLNVHDVRTKIKNLRNTYGQEINKIEKSQRFAGNGSKVYRPTLKWFNTMDEIVKTIKGKKPEDDRQYKIVSSYYIEEETEPDVKYMPADHAECVDIDADEVSSAELNADPTANATDYCQSFMHQEPPLPPAPITRPEHPAPPGPEHPAASRSLSGGDCSMSMDSRSKKRRLLDSAFKRLQEASESLNELVDDEDEFDAFGHLVAVSLRKLPIQLALEAQEELQKIMTRYRRTHHQQESSSSFLPHSHSHSIPNAFRSSASAISRNESDQPRIWISNVTTGTLEDMSIDPLDRKQVFIDS